MSWDTHFRGCGVEDAAESAAHTGGETPSDTLTDESRLSVIVPFEMPSTEPQQEKNVLQAMFLSAALYV